MAVNLFDPIFTDADKAREHLESLLWPHGPVCPRCGSLDDLHKLGGNPNRPGLHQCNACHRSFTVTVGTIFESSHVPLNKWLLASHLMCASKKGMSAHQIHRTIGVTYKTAWFMCHRIREAMKPAASRAPMGGEGKIVEVDETYHGKVEVAPTKTTSGRPYTRGSKAGRGVAGKRAVVTLVERGGSSRSFHMKDHPTVESVTEILKQNVDPATVIHTDESRLYPKPAASFAGHETVEHRAKEYVRGDVHTNTVEGFFSVFKRGMVGVYQHCGEKHLHRYLSEFDFRYSNRVAVGVDDTVRAERAIKGAKGKRLTYRQPYQPA